MIFCIDVEPDPRLVNRFAPEPWAGYEFCQRYFGDLRSRIEAVTGGPAHYSWFLRIDPQVAEPYGSPTFVVDRYRAHIHEVQAHGDELGVHPHAYRWLEHDGVWLHDFGNQPWVEHCVRMALDGFEGAVGRRCLSLRFGDRWLNTRTVAFAERLGVRYDLTVEPGTPALATPQAGELASGRTPDYYRVPREPWVPSEVDFRRPTARATRQIQMIPLTSAYIRLGFDPRAYLRRIYTNGFRHRRQDSPLYMFSEWSASNSFSRMVDRALAAQRRPYLAFAVRTDIGVRRRTFEAVEACLHALLGHPAARRFRFCTPAEALTMLNASSAG